VLAGAGVGAYVWVLDHWFVGVDEETDTVAVFRGINASVLGLDLYQQEEDSGIAVADLSQDIRGKVTDGITVDDRQAAEERVEMLREQSLPACEEEPERAPEEEGSAGPSSPSEFPPAPSTESPAFGTSPGTESAGTDRPDTASPTSGTTSTSSGTGRDCREAE
jgi:protein phosphatase